MLSIVLTGRNDAHGYNVAKRACIGLNTMAEVLEDESDEIVYVDFNTPDDLPTFPESIQDDLTGQARRRLRVLRVRAKQFHRHRPDARGRFDSSMSANVGIRRSDPRNRWILASTFDNVIVPRRPGSSLTQVVAGLADGIYGLPRIDIPEALWESLDRRDPASVFSVFAEWGRRFHLNEVVAHYPFIRYDYPGDFQLMLRAQLFAIHGNDERMIHAYHNDSNLGRRLNLLNHGTTGSALEHLLLYHCHHGRQPAQMHGSGARPNDWGEFVERVCTPELPHQAETWGMAGEEIEEIRLDDRSRTRFEIALREVLPGYTEAEDAEALSREIPHMPCPRTSTMIYDTNHVLPYLASYLTTLARGTVVGYVGANIALIDGVRRMNEAARWGLALPVCAELLPEGHRDTAAIPIQEMLESVDTFIFDVAMMHMPQGHDGLAQPSPRSRGRGADWLEAMYRAFADTIRCEQRRVADGAPPRKLYFVGAIDTPFEMMLVRYVHLVTSPLNTRVRTGWIRTDKIRIPPETHTEPLLLPLPDEVDEGTAEPRGVHSVPTNSTPAREQEPAASAASSPPPP